MVEQYDIDSQDPAEIVAVAAIREIEKTRFVSVLPVLPLAFQLKGKPYQLKNHFYFEPAFRTQMPQRQLFKTARQVGKSQTLAVQGVVRANSIGYFSTLFITPLFEMIRRFSHNYVRPLIEESPLKNRFMGKKTMNSVLQRSFKNGSTMYFSFAFLDVSRTRGIPSDCISIDEIQGLNYDFLPVINESLGGSPWKLTQYSGTPLTLDNTIESLWGESSQAEWIMKCKTPGCGHWNLPCLTHDLIDMIGPWREDISEESPGIVCSKCRKPVDPRQGRWIHANEEKRFGFPGYHVPQIIVPGHYASPDAWKMLIHKMRGGSNTPFNVFLNESCGESYDFGSKLVTESDLKKAACLPWENDSKQAEEVTDDYILRVLGVDWSGMGSKQMSYTALAVLGILPDGGVDCIWGQRSLKTYDPEGDVELIVDAIRRFKCQYVAHDYNGSGGLREVMLINSGFPRQNLFPVAYGQPGKQGIITFKPAIRKHPRAYWIVDKSRTLQLCCHLIRAGKLRFFKYDRKSADERGLIGDFLALLEQKLDRRGISDSYFITRNPNQPDDFAQAVNVGCCCLFQLSSKWPDLSETMKYFIPPELMSMFSPAGPLDWELPP